MLSQTRGFLEKGIFACCDLVGVSSLAFGTPSHSNPVQVRFGERVWGSDYSSGQLTEKKEKDGVLPNHENTLTVPDTVLLYGTIFPLGCFRLSEKRAGFGFYFYFELTVWNILGPSEVLSALISKAHC